MSIEALKLTLEALQDYVDEYGPWSDDSGAQYVLRVGKEALSQPEQEPVAKAWQELPLACQRVASPEQSIELRDALDRFADAISEYDARPLTLDYIQGHKHGCEWSANLAEATDPRTSDWLYDDPHELAKALRKGPEFPPTPPQSKPLTDEAIATVYWGATGQSLRPQDNVLAHKFARAIEAAHGIKE